MKLLYLFLFTFFSLSAQSWQESFLHANEYYKNKNYDEALRLYQKIPNKTAAVWYNMGNCSYKKSDYAHALLYWQRARSLANQGLCKAIDYNCAQAYKKINMQPLPSSIFPHIPPLLLQIAFLAFFILFLSTYFFLLKKKKLLVAIIANITLAFLGILNYASYSKSIQTKGFVITPVANLYAGPDTHYGQKGTITMGNTLPVLDKKNKWLKVANGKEIGWLAENNIVLL